jgi:hypothetical protein
MNSFRLPILTASAAAVLLALSPVALSAQSLSVSPALYAAAEAPAAYSSSSVVDASATAPAATESYAGAASSAAAAPAKTETSTRPFSALGVGFKIGLGGVGFDVATPIAKRFNIRGGAGFFSYNINSTVDNEPVTGSLKLNNAEAMLDWFPFNGSFRLAAGMTIYDNTSISGTVTEAGGQTIKIGNTTYTSNPANPITGTVSAKFGGNVVPRFTLGWGNLAKRNGHFSFDTEFGVEITGTPTVGWAFGGSGCANASGSSTNCSSNYVSIAAQSTDVAAQTASLQSDFNSFKVFPIFNIGIGYKFGH